MSNPIPLLCDHFDMKLSTIHRASRIPSMHVETLHSWYNRSELKPKMKTRLFGLSMVEWGSAWDLGIKSEERKLLWQCYFPHTRPHIYHYLHFAFFRSMTELTEESKLSEDNINRLLRKPKLHKFQLRAIAPFTQQLITSYQSPRTWDGQQTRKYTTLYRAMTDPKRLYQPNEIVTD